MYGVYGKFWLRVEKIEKKLRYEISRLKQVWSGKIPSVKCRFRHHTAKVCASPTACLISFDKIRAGKLKFWLRLVYETEISLFFLN
jgi:hypothetical protein